MHVPWARVWKLWQVLGLGRTVFRNNRIDEICLEKPVPTAVHF